MANTTWNPSDKTANGTLSGGNLIWTSGNTAGVRTIDRVGSGKYYFEVTGSNWSGVQVAIGVANTNVSLSSLAGSAPVGCCVLLTNAGAIWVNATTSGASLPVPANGNTIGIALDATNRLIWFKNVTTGSTWNGNAAYAPDGTGGVSLATVITDSRLLPVYGVTGSTTTGLGTVTLNAGASAFVGAVPSGYTSGFPTNAPPLYAAATQVVSEQWINARADARMTQIFLEHWGIAGTSQPQAVATLVALEQWMTVGAPVTPQARAIIMA